MFVKPKELVLGITPAYAGNTQNGKSWSVRARDHPRLRGEHYITLNMDVIILGSPPPTRGTRAIATKAAPLDRITPAYAGNTAAVIVPCERP